MRVTQGFVLVLGVLFLVAAGLGWSGPGALADEHEAEIAPLTESKARSLLTASFRCPIREVNVAARLGYKFTLHDAETAPGGAGLALLLLAYLRHVEPTDLRALSRSWRDVLRAMAPPEVWPKRRILPDMVVSLLRGPHLTDVSIAQEGDRATGVVAFQAPDAYEGRFEYTARWSDDAWRMAEIRLPDTGVRVTFEGKAWSLHLPDWLRSVNPHRGRLLTLPRVGVVGAEPDPLELELPVIVISVTRDGIIRTDRDWSGQGLVALRNWFRRCTGYPEYRTPDRRAAIPLLLDVDAATPWILCQWLLSIAADRHARIHRVFFGATAEATNENGALACFLPNGPAVEPDTVPRRRRPPGRYVVELRPTHGEGTELGVFWAVLTRIRDRERQRCTFELRVSPRESGHVPAGVVLQVLDLLQQAKVGRLELGYAHPPVEALWEVDSIADLCERVRAKNLNVQITLRGVSMRREPAPLPEGRRVERFVGFGYPRSAWEQGPDESTGETRGVPRLVEEGRAPVETPQAGSEEELPDSPAGDSMEDDEAPLPDTSVEAYGAPFAEIATKFLALATRLDGLDLRLEQVAAHDREHSSARWMSPEDTLNCQHYLRAARKFCDQLEAWKSMATKIALTDNQIAVFHADLKVASDLTRMAEELLGGLGKDIGSPGTQRGAK